MIHGARSRGWTLSIGIECGHRVQVLNMGTEHRYRVWVIRHLCFRLHENTSRADVPLGDLVE